MSEEHKSGCVCDAQRSSESGVMGRRISTIDNHQDAYDRGWQE